MTTPFLCESCGRRHPQEKCASKCVFVGPSLRLHLFFNITNFILHKWMSSKSLPISDTIPHMKGQHKIRTGSRSDRVSAAPPDIYVET